MHWRFLDTWTGHQSWHTEKHVVIEVATDASDRKWGAKLLAKEPVVLSDYFSESQQQLPIMVKEGLALLHTLQALESTLQDVRVDAYV